MKFLNSYIETALWSSTNDNDEPLDANYSADDLADETLERMKRDCERFVEQAADLIDDKRDEQIAHDFWLTRNGHGAGFWDGDYEDAKGEALTKLSHSFGECGLYIGDDGKIYLSGGVL